MRKDIHRHVQNIEKHHKYIQENVSSINVTMKHRLWSIFIKITGLAFVLYILVSFALSIFNQSNGDDDFFVKDDVIEVEKQEINKKAEVKKESKINRTDFIDGIVSSSKISKINIYDRYIESINIAMDGISVAQILSQYEIPGSRYIESAMSISKILSNRRWNWANLLSEKSLVLQEIKNMNKITANDVFGGEMDRDMRSDKMNEHIKSLHEAEKKGIETLSDVRKIELQFKSEYSEIESVKKEVGSALMNSLDTPIPENIKSEYENYTESSRDLSEIETRFVVWQRLDREFRINIDKLRENIAFFNENFQDLVLGIVK